MDIENTLVMHGGAIKALGKGEDEGRPIGRLGGVLCRFTGADDPDQTPERDFFDAATDFKLTDGMQTPVYYHHGLHAGVGVKQIGRGVLRRGEDGICITSELWLDDADGARSYREAQAGRLAWSSGTAAHLVQRTPVAAKGGVSHHIDFWPLGLDASLTPRAAEPRNVAVALKSLITERPGTSASGLPGYAGGAYDGVTGVTYTDGTDPYKSLTILEAGQLEGSRLVDHTARLLDAFVEYHERIGDIAVKSGRVFSAEKHATLCELLAQIREAADAFAELLDAHAPAPDALAGKCLGELLLDDEAFALETSFLHQQMKLNDLLRGLRP